MYGDRFLFRIFTRGEINYAQSKKTFTKILAGKFAAKEAVIKATGIFVPFATIQVLNNQYDIPYIKGRDDLIISISHEKEYAVAIAIKVKGEK